MFLGNVLHSHILQCGVISSLCIVVTNGLSLRPMTRESSYAYLDRLTVPIEVSFSTAELAHADGYSVQSHEVLTTDGYILTIFRIQQRNTNATSKGPILLAHCLMCSSDDWLLLLPNSADCLPYVLANEGYDVWLINFRGNGYSQKHEHLSIDSFDYWDFSVHEMGVYDLPATVEYILNTTNARKLSYIGHSMGTATFFIAMDQHRHLQEKVERMVALAPAAYLKHMKTPFRVLENASALIMWYFKITNHGRIFEPLLIEFLHLFSPELCSGELISAFCLSFIFLAVGYDASQVSKETLANLLGHTPADTSGKTLSHFTQWMHIDRFQEYDYGAAENLIKYGSTLPPLYHLETNKVPTFLFYGLNDLAIADQDLERVARELGNVVRKEPVQYATFNHLDFLFAKDAKNLVYNHVLDFLTTKI